MNTAPTNNEVNVLRRPLRVMHLVWRLEAAGMENGVINLCHRLPSEEFTTSICTFAPDGAAEQRVDRDRCDLVLTKRLMGNDPTLPFRLARVLRRQKIDILHSHNWVTLIEGVIAGKLAGVPVIVHGEHGKLRTKRRQIVAQRWAWQKVDQVLSVSAALADRMADEITFPRERVLPIANGVDTVRFSPPTQADPIAARRELGLPEATVLVGMVARFVPFKDHAGVIRALAAVHSSVPNLHLALAGDGPLRDELESLSEQLGIGDRVHFLGALPRVDPFLKAIDFLVSNSSHNEGMSNAVLEAMAMGVPVVATRVAASPELLAGGDCGRLIPRRNSHALATALREYADDPNLRRKFSRKGRDRIERHYSIGSMVESYRRVYLHLARSADANGRQRAFTTNPTTVTATR